MKEHNKQSEEIRRYLLGGLPPQDLPTFEERFFVDSELYEELSIVEDDLIDEYLRGELSSSDRESFESHFMLAPERHEKVRFARALKKYVTVQEAIQLQPEVVREESRERTVDKDVAPKKRSFFSFLPFQNPIVSYALAAAMLLVVVGGSWLIWKGLPTREPGNVLAVALTPGLVRSDGETKTIVIPVNTGTVRLQLLLTENQYQIYEASLLDFEGRVLTTKNNLNPEPANPPAVVFDVPAGMLPRGDYRVKLSGLTSTGNSQSVSSYNFRVMQ